MQLPTGNTARPPAHVRKRMEDICRYLDDVGTTADRVRLDRKPYPALDAVAAKVLGCSVSALRGPSSVMLGHADDLALLVRRYVGEDALLELWGALHDRPLFVPLIQRHGALMRACDTPLHAARLSAIRACAQSLTTVLRLMASGDTPPPAHGQNADPEAMAPEKLRNLVHALRVRFAGQRVRTNDLAAHIRQPPGQLVAKSRGCSKRDRIWAEKHVMDGRGYWRWKAAP
ncbi:hypothetical protein [Methylibium sp.]|uniref:hypothetical protein n=1 Tax=Methylibium sp. TaxID=2067992 RepID=UPI00178F2113|nr:hypothetical protein [Methylibium sp.]MBA3590298.1 hypothetical protein [Methylibium sp.]